MQLSIFQKPKISDAVSNHRMDNFAECFLEIRRDSFKSYYAIKHNSKIVEELPGARKKYIVFMSSTLCSNLYLNCVYRWAKPVFCSNHHV